MIDILRFLLLISLWLFVWFHVPPSGHRGHRGVSMGWRLARAALILASMLAVLYLRI